jgi:RNA polymerase sigma factor (sigma-70 family)
MTQFTAVKRIDNDNPPANITPLGELNRSDFFNKGAAIALSLIMDCYLLLNANGDIVLSNSKADQLLQKMQADSCNPQENSCSALPESALQACQLLLENCEYLSNHSLPSQAMLTVDPDIQLRISLVATGPDEDPLFLVTLEDKRQTSIAQATVDQWLYGLTNREKEVWALRLQDYSYQDIAAELYLSVNTVKKHMKTILAKQEDWRLNTFGLLAS